MLTLIAQLNRDGSHQYSTQIYEGQRGSGNPLCHRTFKEEADFIEKVNSVIPERKSTKWMIPDLHRIGFIDIPYSLQMFDRQAALFGWHL
jgi:hypothetical protein